MLIATAAHVTALTDRLNENGFVVAELRAYDQLILPDAGETLAQFMVSLCLKHEFKESWQERVRSYLSAC